MDEWKRIWSNRPPSTSEDVLAGLIEADGFDKGAGRIEAPAWRGYCEWVAGLLGIEEGESVFEVGCGSGAFLYPFFRLGHKVGGMDYSEPLISAAREVMKGMSFSAAEAIDLDEAERFDVVVSNSVFQYFPNLDYASAVVRKMLLKAERVAAVLEIPDLALKDEAERERSGALPPGEYEKKYAGLGHLYYDRSWFEKIAAEHGHTATIYDQKIEGYGNSRFRFNVVIEKKH